MTLNLRSPCLWLQYWDSRCAVPSFVLCGAGSKPQALRLLSKQAGALLSEPHVRPDFSPLLWSSNIPVCV